MSLQIRYNLSWWHLIFWNSFYIIDKNGSSPYKIFSNTFLEPCFKKIFPSFCLHINLCWFYKYFYKFREKFLVMEKTKREVKVLREVKTLSLLALDLATRLWILVISFCSLKRLTRELIQRLCQIWDFWAIIEKYESKSNLKI